MNFFKKNYDFISIGDNATDAFIELEDAIVDNEKNLLCMRFKDKILYKDVVVIPAVGNSANAAVSAVRLGLKTAFISNIGKDDWGKECLEALKKESVSTEYIVAHEGKKTNYHYVLRYGDDRTILVKHEEYEYSLPDFGSPKWVYFSSTGGNSLPFHSEIEKYLNDHPEIKFAFQPGTYQMKFGRDKLAGIYRRADLFICNKEESQKILGMEEGDIKDLLKMMADIGPKIVVITDGKKGAYVYDTASGDFWMMMPYPDPKPPVDRTGAGDAFSSTFTVALAFGKSIEDALRWAPINSMSVVQYIGAQEGLLTIDKIEKFLAAAPEYYKPNKI